MNEPSELVRQAFAALDDGRPAEASALLKDHIWRDPSDGVAYAALGVALSQLGDSHAALEAMEQAHYLRPVDPRVLYNYGLVLAAAGQPKAARIRFAAALKVDPHYERAVRCLAQLEASEAQSSLSSGLPDSWNALPSLGGEASGQPSALQPGSGSTITEHRDEPVPPTAPRVTPGAPAAEEVSDAEYEPTLTLDAEEVVAAHASLELAERKQPMLAPLRTASGVPLSAISRSTTPQTSPEPQKARSQGDNPSPAVMTGAGIAAILLLGGYLFWPSIQPAAARWLPRKPAAQIQPGHLRGADLVDASLRSLKLEGEDMRGARLVRADLTGTQLGAADLSDADLTAANLTGADLGRSVMLKARLDQADLTGAYLRGADLTASALTGANLSKAYLHSARLSGADLTGATLREANLKNARFDSANLSGADLSGASLEGADLSGAILAGTRLRDATFDRATRWPEG
ncbi:MAG TPA: pentapeptide repeat-containing protein, partial [Armatimonadota bacterium]|nr:pentapeptide repeat-containing protein [Armatimonadota bacterium]